ncbi:MAG TPA: mechanosensitive ion channel [Candidatus Kapabacteria bacterium]|nr:mechanosensitive ion channel [Candidatus Kapabacteria bacterium]
MNEFVFVYDILNNPFLTAILYVIVFFMLAKIIDFIVTKIILRFTKKTKTTLDDKIIAIIHQPLFFTIFLVGCIVAFSQFDLSEKFVFPFNSFIYSIILIIWTVASIRTSRVIINIAFHKFLDVTGLSKDILPLFVTISKVTIIVICIMTIFSIWKIDITPLLASAGIVGAIIAFAAKDAFANLFGGISIFLDKPFKIDDIIDIGGNERGKVVNIGIRSTRIQTPGGMILTVPNADIANSKISNESITTAHSKVSVNIGVAYGSDVRLVEKTLLEIAYNYKLVVKEPVPLVRFLEFADSSLNFLLVVWIEDITNTSLVRNDINYEINKRFTELGIEIPFPQRDVHLRK